jgi:hypothetical protein
MTLSMPMRFMVLGLRLTSNYGTAFGVHNAPDLSDILLVDFGSS